MGKEYAAYPARLSEWIESCRHLCDELCKHGKVKVSRIRSLMHTSRVLELGSRSGGCYLPYLLGASYLQYDPRLLNLIIIGAMSVHHVNARLQQLNDAHEQTIQLIHRLGRHSVPLGSNPLNSNVRLELSTEIHQNLKDQEEELELLRQETDDQTIRTAWTSSARKRNGAKERDYSEVVAQLARLAEDLKLCVSQLTTLIRELIFKPSQSPFSI